MAQPVNQSPRFALRPLALLAALACASFTGAQAQTAGAPVQIVAAGPALKEVVISGSRSEQNPDDLPMSIDVINARALEEGQVRDIRDAVFASDAQLPPDGASYVPVRELSERLDRVLADLLLPRTEPLPARSLPSPPRASVAAVVTGDLQRCPA